MLKSNFDFVIYTQNISAFKPQLPKGDTMLGEVHSLTNDFPEHEAAINKLKETDSAFLDSMKEYDALDKKIRTLELNGAPIADDEMHQLKHDRAVMKDALYKRVVAS